MVYAKKQKEDASTTIKVFALVLAILFLEVKENALFLDAVPMMLMTDVYLAYLLSF